MIKIILVEDHQLIRFSLRALIEKHKEVIIVAEVANGKELIKLLQTGINADLILSDIMMPEMDGIAMITEIKNKGYEIPVLLLTMLEDEKYSSNAFVAGASGYLSKNVAVDELLLAIKYTAQGKRYFSSELCIKLLERYHKQLINSASGHQIRIDFSDRELSVIQLIAEGKTNQQMADELFLSRRTVEGIRQQVIDRTGSKNSAALIKFLVLNGYLN